MIYRILDNKWVRLVEIVPKRFDIALVENEKNKQVLTHIKFHSDHILGRLCDKV